MNIKKYMFILTTIVLILSTIILSTIGIAEENKTKVVAISKDVGIDNSSGKYIVLINIATNKIGHLVYMEEYYSVDINNSDKLKLDSRIIYYNDTMKNDTLTLKIKRPLDKNGEQYNYVKAIGFIDNEKVLNSWYKYVNRNKKEDKKSPGFGVAILVVSILSVAYIIKEKKR